MTSALDPSELTSAFGPDSPAALALFEQLALLYRESESIPPVANSYLAWTACRPLGSADSDTFIRHTCVSLLCRLAAYRFLEPLPSERDLWNVICGDYFVSSGLSNFLGEDFFSWPYFRRSMGIGDDASALDATRPLLSALQPFDLTSPPPNVLSELHSSYQQATVDHGAATTTNATTELEENPYLSCLAPRCGDGSEVASAVSVSVTRLLSNGEHPFDTALSIPGQFLCMTSDPLAASVSSVSFLFALGETVKGPHPPILIPVYFADAELVPEARQEPNGERSYAIDVAGGISLPEQVAIDPLYLDWLLGRLPNYLRGTALRLRAQPEEVAVQEVLNAWYNYLTSPKARTPIPEPLTPAAADVMVEAARTLINAYVHGSGPAPLHLARNAPAPLFAARREFDLTI